METYTQTQTLPPELGEKVASYIAETDQVLAGQQQMILEQQQKLAALEETHKEAGAVPVTQEKIAHTVENMVGAGLLTAENRDQAVHALRTDPASALLGFVNKLAAQRIETSLAPPSIGGPTDDGPSPRSPLDRTNGEADSNFERHFGMAS